MRGLIPKALGRFFSFPFFGSQSFFLPSIKISLLPQQLTSFPTCVVTKHSFDEAIGFHRGLNGL